MEEDATYEEVYGEDEIRTCECYACGHFDNVNMCCWQSGKWGLSFDVEEGDDCHLGYTVNDWR